MIPDFFAIFNINYALLLGMKSAEQKKIIKN